jgi:hypothetical protein
MRRNMFMGKLPAYLLFVITLTTFSCAAVTTAMLLAACSDAGAPAQIQQQLRDAVSTNDLEAVRQLLSKGAEPDQAQGSNKTALTLAGEMVSKAKGTDAANKPLAIFVALCKHIRHRNNKTLELIGSLSASLRGLSFTRPASPGELTVDLQINLEDGKSYQLELSTEETTYKNTSAEGRAFAVLFKETYRVRGVLLEGTFEAEEIELRKGTANDTSKGESKEGMFIPVPLFLPSTAKAVTPFLK